MLVIGYVVLLEERDELLLKRMLLIVPSCSAIYFVTAATFDSLTPNTPYPVCQASLESPFSCTQPDELTFTTRVISAAE